MLRYWCRASSLFALFWAITLTTSHAGTASAQCCGRPPVQDAGPLAIQGPTRSDPYKLVELIAVGDITNRALIWDVFPEDTADLRELPGGRIVFTGPPGTYRIKLRAIRLQGEAITTETARFSVTIDKPFNPQPVPPTVPPVQPPTTPPQTPPQPPASKIDPEKALGQIKFPAGQGQMSYCTATIVHPRRKDGRWDILTAAHCVPAVGTKGTMTTRDRTKNLAVTVAVVDRRCDLCWLVTDNPQDDLYCAILASENPAVGTAVWHAGYGVDKPENREDGTVRNSENSDGQTQYHLSVSSGDSGGGIFNAKTGELLSAVCCTAIKAQKTDMWGGSARQAQRLRPKPTSGVHDSPERSIFLPLK